MSLRSRRNSIVDMRKFRTSCAVVFALAAVSFREASAAPAARRSANLELHVIDVGQGDGMLLKCPDGKIGAIIDSGDQREGSRGLKAFKKYVESQLKRGGKVELVIASHPHADHIGGLDWVLKTFKVGYLVDNGEESNTATFGRYRTLRDKLDAAGDYASATNDPVELAICGSKVKVTFFTAGGFSSEDCADDPNICSVFARIDYGESSFLLTGDAHAEAETSLLSDEGMVPWLDVDVLKVGHHGSDTSSDPAFLAAVSPECAVISSGDRDKSSTNRRWTTSTGKQRGYGHPRLKTIVSLNAELAKSGRQPSSRRAWAWSVPKKDWVQSVLSEGLFVTALDGTVVVSADEEKVTCGKP